MGETRKILCKAEYDGSAYRGWQVQDSEPSIQGEIQRALDIVTQTTTYADASSRTDAGVHAKGQIFTFKAPKDISIRRLINGVNSLMSKDISIIDMVEVPDDFLVRQEAKGKLYRYLVQSSKAPAALDRARLWWLRDELDWSLCEQALEDFRGVHDFSAFRGRHCTAISPIKEIYQVRIKRWKQGHAAMAAVEVEGSGFVKHMVRFMVGTLVQIARRRAPVDSVKLALEECRMVNKLKAPSEGLYLERVFLDPDPFALRKSDSFQP